MPGEASNTRVRELEARVLAQEQANRELSISHARLRAILDNEPECVKLLAADGSLCDMNPAGLRMLEAESVEQLRNHCIYPLIVAEHRSAFRALNERVWKGGSGVLEFEIVGLKGGRRWLETHASPLRDDGGAVTALLGITRDITARKAAEAALLTSSQRMDALLESISDAFLALDRDWCFVYVNDKAAQTFGRSREHLLGRNIWAEFPQLVGQPFHHAYHQAMEERKYVVTEDTYAPRDQWFENRIYPTDDGISVFVTETTERKRAERALAETQARLTEQLSELEQLYQTAPVGLALIGRDLRFVRVNERLAAIDGRPVSDHVGRSLEEIVPDLSSELREVYQHVLDTGRPVLDMEINGFTPAEPQLERNWLASYLPVHGRDGDVIGISAVIADVTERKRAELERAQLLAREKEARTQLHRILESVSDAFVALDKDWRYTYVNRRAGEIFGRQPEDLIGKHIWTEFPEGVGQPFQSAYAKAFAEQQPQTIEEYYPPYDAWFENRIYPHPDGLSIVFQDITGRKRAERSLQQSETRLHEAQRIAQLGDWEFDVASRAVTWSPQVYALYRRDPLLGPPDFEEFLACYDTDNRAVLEGSLAQLMHSGRQQAYELQVALPDGAIAHHSVVAVPILDDDGRVLRVRGIVQDISDRKRAEAQLRKSERQLHMVMDGLGPHMFVGLLDTRGVVLMANRPARTVASLNDDEIIGRPVEDTYWWAYSDAVRLRLRDAVRRAAQGGPVRYDEQIRVAEDEFVWVDFSIFPLHDESGAVVSLVPSAIVINERKLAEQALQASESQLRVIYEHVEDAVFLLEVAGARFRFISVNPRFLAATGLTSAQVVGQWVDEVIPQPALASVLEHYAHAVQTGLPVHWEEVSVYPAGARHGEVTVAPVMDGAGRCTRLIGTVHDVTARMLAKQQLRDASLRQQSLARRLVEVQEAEQRHLSAELHDRIGQNLTALSINLNIIGSRRDAAHAEATATRLHDSRKLLETTIASVRDLITELRPPVLDDYGLLASLRWFGEQVCERTGLQVVVLGEEPLPRLEQRVESALFRISQEALTNIVKHSHARQVAVALRSEGSRVTLSIADDGAGFDLAAQRQPGPRAHWGLEMMGERAEAVGARLRVESVLGHGTRVIVDVERQP